MGRTELDGLIENFEFNTRAFEIAVDCLRSMPGSAEEVLSAVGLVEEIFQNCELARLALDAYHEESRTAEAN
jgi:hypothetical protein